MVIDFNDGFSAVVEPQILIKYLLHTSQNSLGHVGAKKLYHFPEMPLLFQRHEKEIT